MEPIIALVGGAIAAGAILLLEQIGARYFLSKYGSIINKTFEVLDPIAGDLIKSYEGSSFQEALELAVYRVADSKIDHEDVIAISQYVASKFSPAIAASKTLDVSTEEGQASLEIADKVRALSDGATLDELVDVVKAALPLVK